MARILVSTTMNCCAGLSSRLLERRDYSVQATIAVNGHTTCRRDRVRPCHHGYGDAGTEGLETIKRSATKPGDQDPRQCPAVAQ